MKNNSSNCTRQPWHWPCQPIWKTKQIRLLDYEHSLAMTMETQPGHSHGNKPNPDLIFPSSKPFSRAKFAYISLNRRLAHLVALSRSTAENPAALPGRISGKNSVRNATRSMRCGELGADSPAGQSDLDSPRRSGRRVTDEQEPDPPSQPPDFRQTGFVRASSPPRIRDRIPGFHTDFTQHDRSGPHTLRHAGKPETHRDAHESATRSTLDRFPCRSATCIILRTFGRLLGNH